MVVLALLLPCLLISASAAEPYPVLSYHDLVKDIVISGNDTIITLELPLEQCFFSVYDNVKDNEVARGDGPTVSYIPKPLIEHTFSIGFKWLSAIDLPDGAEFKFVAHISAENLAKTAQFQPRIGLAYTEEARKADVVLYGKRVNAQNPLGLKVDETFTSTVIYKNKTLDDKLPYKVTPVAALADVSSFYTEKPVTVTLLSCLVTFNLNYKPPVDFDDTGIQGDSQDQLLDGTSNGRVEMSGLFGGAAVTLALFAHSFAFLTNCVQPFIDIPWLKSLLTVSLGIGLSGFVLNFGLTALSKASHTSSNSSKRGGK